MPDMADQFPKMSLRLAFEVKNVTAEVRDSKGGITRTYGIENRPRGALIPLRGTERVDGQQVRPDAQYGVLLRYYKGMTVEKRLVLSDEDSTRTFEILYHKTCPQEIKQWTWLEVKEQL